MVESTRKTSNRKPCQLSSALWPNTSVFFSSEFIGFLILCSSFG
uniref:Uncharacterized protein n=1 Tax=Populus trichocarpa TaxID=3694 RepID=A0A3N7GZT0_POPTR